MPTTRSRTTFTPVELNRLLRRLEDVVGEATQLRERIARRLSAERATRPPRSAAARKSTAPKRR